MKVEEPALAVVHALDRLGVRHYVSGVLASSLHGEPGATHDPDLVATLSAIDLRRLKHELGGRFSIDEEEYLHAVNDEGSFTLIDQELGKVEVFCVSPRGYQREALERAAELELPGEDPFSSVKVASTADLLLSRLRWYRQGGETSEREWRDLLFVARANAGRLELDYLRRWSQEQGTLDLFDRLLNEAAS